MRITLAEPVTTAVFTIAFADYVADTIFDNCGPSDYLRKLIAVVAAGTYFRKPIKTQMLINNDLPYTDQIT